MWERGETERLVREDSEQQEKTWIEDKTINNKSSSTFEEQDKTINNSEQSIEDKDGDLTGDDDKNDETIKTDHSSIIEASSPSGGDEINPGFREKNQWLQMKVRKKKV